MSDPIHNLRILHNNPFIFSSALVAFFKELGEKERSFLLGYFVLPMTLHSSSHDFLCKATQRSSLRSMLKDQERIYGLDERVARYRWMTNTTVQYLLGTGGISMQSQLVVAVDEQQAADGPSPDGVVKAARRLGILFHPYDVPTIFRMLGVMAL